MINSKVLESLIIEDNDSIVIEEFLTTEEKIQLKKDLKDSGKTLLTGLGICAIAAGGYALYNKIEESRKEKMKSIRDTQEKKNRSQQIQELRNRFNLHSPQEINRFKEILRKDIESRIKKMIIAIEKTDEYEKLKEKLRKRGFEEYELKHIKKGFYTCEDEGEDYYCIVPGQDEALASSFHYHVAEVLNEVHKVDPRYLTLSFDTGDGDEGCVYLDWKI